MELKGFFLTSLDDLLNICKAGVFWAYALTTTCCGIELATTAISRHKLPCFFRNVPKQCNLLIVCGVINRKMASLIKEVWNQMPSPKWAMAVGSCAIGGGAFQTYSVLKGLDCIIPVDVYLPGCPPNQEEFVNALLLLKKKSKHKKSSGFGVYS